LKILKEGAWAADVELTTYVLSINCREAIGDEILINGITSENPTEEIKKSRLSWKKVSLFKKIQKIE